MNKKVILIIEIIVLIICLIILNKISNNSGYKIYTNEVRQQVMYKKRKAKKKKTKKKAKYNNLKVKTASRETYINYAQQYSGYDATQMVCLINLWQQESGWSATIRNKRSGACGIPQSKPCNKIKKQQGSYNWDAQIRWGINRINWVYKNPCNAWRHSRKYGGY